MVWLKRGAWTLLVSVLAVLAAGGIYAARSFPKLDGALQAPGLKANVSVQRDGADVTHILAQSGHDAWFSLGYVHAQERGWQLEFNRRVMHGELSEVFGEATLETDKLLRTLGVMAAARRQWVNLPPATREALQAYADGVNAFNSHPSQALGPEFQVLRVTPGQWEAVDSMGWAIMMALDLGGNWGTEFARLSAARVLSTGRMWQAFPPYPGELPASKVDLAQLYVRLGVYRSDNGLAGADPAAAAPDRQMAASTGPQQRMAQWANELAQNAGNVEGKGSNNWVVAGSHTVSGKPLLANDPHLSLSAPAIWYFAHLQAPGINVVGATLPGLPFVVLGHTDKVAWGFTNTGPDVQDLYLERINPENPRQYRVPDVDGKVTWADFKSRTEVIHVKGKPDVVLPVRETRHGPVLSDGQKFHADVLDMSRFVLALRWSALDEDNITVQAGLDGNRANSVKELLAAYRNYHSPMQNVVAADTDGNVAYKAVGKAPLRRPDNDIQGLAPAPGWEPRYDWAGWIPYDQTPQDLQAVKGWIATANQRITPPDYPYFMGQDWATPDRFNRIEQLLAATPRHDLASMQKLHGDITSLAARRLIPYLQKTKGTHALAAAAQTQLAGFDGVMRADSAAPLIFAAWVDELTRALVGAKLGEANLKTMYGKRHFRLLVEDVLARDDGWWCAPKSCAQQSADALDRALARLAASYGNNLAAWQWGQAHAARSTHQPFDNVAALAPLFDVNVPNGGDSFTVDVGHYWLNDARNPFATRHAASMRAVYDLADLDNSRFIYQTGQSGLVFSARYRDMSQAWADVQYRPLQLKPAEVRHTLTLTP
jgi:penicillin amidase